jgi:hypothetical protein
VSEGNDAHDAPFPQDFHPQRFLGSASMWVENVCPRFQEIQFRLVVDWDQPLCVWADILISDELPDTIEES